MPTREATEDDGSCDLIVVTFERLMPKHNKWRCRHHRHRGSGAYSYSWTGNDVEVSSDEDASLAAGTYAVTVITASVTGSLSSVVIDNTDNVFEVLGNFNIYPNPSAGQATIVCPQGIVADIRIFNMKGQVVKSIDTVRAQSKLKDSAMANTSFRW